MYRVCAVKRNGETKDYSKVVGPYKTLRGAYKGAMKLKKLFGNREFVVTDGNKYYDLSVLSCVVI